tara:strand:+ start:433 stop:756 length:324 start_codon:yes stop_codon:yes gene_type:complete
MEAPEKKEAKKVKISEPVKKSWEKEGMRDSGEEKKEEKKDEKKEEKKEEKKDDKKEEEEKKEDEDGVGGDSFMREMTKKFAVEGGKDKEVPNGEFWFDRKGAKEVAI